MIALAAGLLLRFGAKEAAVIFFGYSKGFYGMVLVLSALSHLAVFFYKSSGDGYKLGSDPVEQFELVFRNHVIVFVSLIVILFMIQAGELLSRRLVAYTFVISFILDLFVRESIRHILQKAFENSAETLTIADRIVKVLKKEDKAYGDDVKHVFAVGCKGIPAEYGGFESFMHALTGNRKDKKIVYHVARLARDELRFIFHGAVVYDVHVPSIGAAKAVYYDLAALDRAISWCRKNKIKEPVFFVMACRIGPFIGFYKRRIKALGGKLYVNPDGHEWKRKKWNTFIRRYWKVSEKGMVRAADAMICDSKNIEKYIKEEYSGYTPATCYIAYGVWTASRYKKEDPELKEEYENWLSYNRTVRGNYYLIVGRFVPENNFETMIREFMASDSKKDLIIITTENERFKDRLERELGLKKDRRVKFAGTVYNKGLLFMIRENAFAYLHGHSVGGTNPSLLESLSATKLNLLLDVGFNREVAEDAGLYWELSAGSLKGLIEKSEKLSDKEIEEYGKKAFVRIEEDYRLDKIVGAYERVFREGIN